MTNAVRMLTLLRHAKAEPAAGRPDVERPLSARGHGDAAAAGAWLGSHGHPPELVICSPARRTRQTWHAVANALNDVGAAPPAPRAQPSGPGAQPSAPGAQPSGRGGRPSAPLVRYEPAVYAGSAADLLGLVQGVAEEITSVLVVGHNPAISQLSELLDPDAGMDSDGLPTSGLAVHQVTGSWAECGTRRAPRAAAHTARG